MFERIEQSFCSHFIADSSIEPARFPQWMEYQTKPVGDEFYANYTHWVRYILRIVNSVHMKIQKHRRSNQLKYELYSREARKLIQTCETVANFVYCRMLEQEPTHPAISLIAPNDLPDFDTLHL